MQRTMPDSWVYSCGKLFSVELQMGMKKIVKLLNFNLHGVLYLYKSFVGGFVTTWRRRLWRKT